MAEIPWMNADGTFADNWHETALPEELRAEASLKDFKTFPDLAKAWVTTKKELGTRIALPKTDDPNAVTAFLRKHFNVPDKPEGYEIGKPQVPEGMVYDENLVSTFLQAAAAQGMPKGMAKAILEHVVKAQVDAYQTTAKTRKQNAQKLLDASSKVLQDKWGDKLDKNLTLAVRAFMAKAPEELKNTLAKAARVEKLTDAEVARAFQADSAMAQVFYLLAEATANDSIVTGDGTQQKEELKKPMFPENPEMYAIYPDDDPRKRWFIEQGYDFTTRSWKGK